MPSSDPRRRRFVSLLGGSLFALGGCLSDDGATPTASPTPEPTGNESPQPTESEEPTETEPSTPAAQPPGWPMGFDGNVIVLDEDDGDLFAVVSQQHEATAELVAVQQDGSVRWSTEFEADSHGNGPNEPDEAGWEWSTWLTPGAIYLAAGVRHEWWAVRAFDRESGDELWSVREERQLAVRDVTADWLLVTAEEIFVPETSHDTPEEPLTSFVYRVARETGEATKLGEADGVRGATATDDGAYVLGLDSLAAFELSGDNGVQWERQLSGEGVDAFTDGDWVVSIAENGKQSEIAGFSPAGDRQWSLTAPDTHSSDTLFVDDTVYVGGADGVVAVRTDGTVAWRDRRPGGWFVHDDSTGRMYTRSGMAADAAAAYGPEGEWRWTFDPDATNAWPTTVTDDAVLTTAITGEHADDPFKTVFSVDPETGDGSPLVGVDTVFSVESVGNRAYLATGEGIQAYEPSPGN